MVVIVSFNGSKIEIPISGASVEVDGSQIRFVGFKDLEKVVTQQMLADLRREYILSQVPSSPDFTTIEELTEKIESVSHDTIRRVLLEAQHAGRVTAVQPHRRARGNAARHWTKKE